MLYAVKLKGSRRERFLDIGIRECRADKWFYPLRKPVQMGKARCGVERYSRTTDNLPSLGLDDFLDTKSWIQWVLPSSNVFTHLVLDALINRMLRLQLSNSSQQDFFFLAFTSGASIEDRSEG
jgi:hypothetical protein